MEVDDRHNDKLIVEDHSDTQGKIHVPGEPWSQKLAPDPAYDSTDHRDGERRRRRGRRAGLSTTSLCLAISLALALVLAAVAAGVAGSIAAKRQRSLDTCLERSSTSSPTQDNNNNNNTTTTCPGSIALEPNTSDTTTTVSALARLTPESECRNLTSPFSTFKQGQYELHCGSDLPTTDRGADLMGTYAYTMSDCINACAYWNWRGNAAHVNVTCHAVSFNVPLGPEEGNCWLKGLERIGLVQSEVIDSAVLLFS